MCGLTGLLQLDPGDRAEDLTRTVLAMADALRHRGPDGRGAWVDAAAGVALGHRRLSVFDLSELGSQPMVSADGRYVVVYNGEIYNFRALRDEIERSGFRFRGHCDTEVLLAAVERWGLETALGRLNGMFAMALWDTRHRRLHLVRDRVGEKPLYYGWVGRTMLFASELKAFRAHPAFTARVDRGSLALYLRHNCVPGPRSIYEGVFKLPPGSVLTVRADGDPPAVVGPGRYWSARDAVASGVASRLPEEPAPLADAIERLLGESIALRSEADVPTGALLSGGIDSSLVVALMQAQSSRPVRTFTVGFDDPAYDESDDAARVARHLGTDHVDVRVSSTSAMGVIPRLHEIYDEPFGDTSQIPLVLVSEVARRDVTVVLSGDGGDELFGGYNRYAWEHSLRHSLGWLPRPARAAFATGTRRVPPALWDALWSTGLVPRRFRVRNPGTKIQKLADLLGSRSAAERYMLLVSHWKRPAGVVVGADEPASVLTEIAVDAVSADPVEQMMYFDLATYLPDDILVKLDRAAMSVGLEARVPLLDHRLVEWAWRVPLSLKLRDGRGKWLLREVLSRHVPPELFDRPKTGFGPPIGSWLRGPLRDWSEDLLDERRMRQEGFLEPAVVRAAWTAHLTGKRDAGYEVWDVLMFQSWLQGSGAA
ncbi:MAG: asparagine synthase (glutamine-hydrolyzing) [Acidimicrobiales bacterium]